jgi:hypothetical protein
LCTVNLLLTKIGQLAYKCGGTGALPGRQPQRKPSGVMPGRLFSQLRLLKRFVVEARRTAKRMSRRSWDPVRRQEHAPAHQQRRRWQAQACCGGIRTISGEGAVAGQLKAKANKQEQSSSRPAAVTARNPSETKS